MFPVTVFLVYGKPTFENMLDNLSDVFFFVVLYSQNLIFKEHLQLVYYVFKLFRELKKNLVLYVSIRNVLQILKFVQHSLHCGCLYQESN